MSAGCGYTWRAPSGIYRCCHEASHTGRHEPYRGAPAFVAVGQEGRAFPEEGEAMTARDRACAAIGWDAAVAAMRYEDGTPVEIISMTNPYRP